MNQFRHLDCLLRRTIRRILAHSDGEQATVRVLIGTVVVLYLLGREAFHDSSGQLSKPDALVFLAFFYAYSWLVFFDAASRMRASNGRRLAYLLVDLSCVTYGLWATGEVGAPLVVLYLWVTLGNGFRFGASLMFCAMVTSSLGIAFVAVYSDYWEESQSLLGGVFAAVVVLSLYVYGLLGRVTVQSARAERANRAKSEALAKVSHELMTPIAGVQALLELLKHDTSSGQRRRLLQKADSAIWHMEGLVADILDIVQIESGSLRVQMQEVCLYEVIGDAVDWVQDAAKSKRIGLNWAVASSVPLYLTGDARRLRQVLVNLLSNAVKYTDGGGITLTVVAQEENESCSRIRFEVGDSGIGMDSNDLSTMFDGFVQGTAAEERGVPGLGLGATISKQVVELLGGTLWVDSVVDGGTRVGFDVDFQRSEHVTEFGPTESMHILLVTADGYTSTRSLLTVESDVTSRVSSESFVATSVEGWGASELEFLERFDAAVIRGNGFDVSAVIDKIRCGSERCPIVLWTDRAVDTAADWRFCCSSGVNAVLNIEHDELELLRLLRKVVRVTARASRPAPKFPPVGALGKALLAEDDGIGQMFASEVLRKVGFDVHVVSDGGAALEKLSAGEFSIALLDMRLPVLSGIEVLQSYRSSTPDTPTPIIFLTADQNSRSISACLDAGAAGYLTKPVSAAALEQSVLEFYSADRRQSP